MKFSLLKIYVYCSGSLEIMNNFLPVIKVMPLTVHENSPSINPRLLQSYSFEKSPLKVYVYCSDSPWKFSLKTDSPCKNSFKIKFYFLLVIKTMSLTVYEKISFKKITLIALIVLGKISFKISLLLLLESLKNFSLTSILIKNYTLEILLKPQFFPQ